MNRSPLRSAGFAVALATVLLLAAAPVGAWYANPGSSGIGVGNWAPVNGGPIEYTFVYNGDNLQSEVVLAADPGSSVGFNVYSDPQWQALVAGDTSVTPVGKGTTNPYESGNLSWQTNSSARQVFHIQVYRATSQTAAFWIVLKGNGGGPLYRGSGSGGVILLGPTLQGPVLVGPTYAKPAPQPSVKPIGPQCYWQNGRYWCSGNR